MKTEVTAPLLCVIELITVGRLLPSIAVRSVVHLPFEPDPIGLAELTWNRLQFVAHLMLVTPRR